MNEGIGGIGGNQGDEIMEKLSLIMAQMTTKTDLETFKTEIKGNIKIVVSEAVDPLKDEMVSLSERVTTKKNLEIIQMGTRVCTRRRKCNNYQNAKRNRGTIGYPEACDCGWWFIQFGKF